MDQIKFLAYEELEGLKRKELKKRANDCLRQAAEADETTRRQALLAEANFYVSELDRRHDSRISIRDFILESVVIVLIGVEICLAIKQGHDEEKRVGAQIQALMQIQKEMAGQEHTMQAMDTRVRLQLARMSQINVAADISLTNREYGLINYSATRIELWGRKFGSEREVFFKTPILVQRTKTGMIPAAAFVAAISDPKRGKDGLFTPIVVYLTDDIGNKFTWRAEHRAEFSPDGHVSGVSTRNDAITMEDWEEPK